MIFKVDYHFHPNLPKNNKRAVKKCRKWWDKLSSHGVNVIIVTEHAYKDPKYAFFLMQKTKPKKCFCFPGIEYLTKEGVDIIIFSKNPNLYNFKELKPFNLTFEEAVNFIKKKKKIVGFIPHPHSMSYSAVIKKLGIKKYQKFVNKLGSVEVTNTVLSHPHYFLVSTPSKHFFKKSMEHIEKVKKLPKESYPKKIKLLTAGSDAHHFNELGTYVIIKSSPKNLFKAITHNKNPEIVEKKYKKVNYILSIKQGITAFKEFSTKKKMILSGKSR